MKNLVIYSSKTGNTKKIAQAIASSLNYEILSVENVKNLDGVGKIIFGFYVDKGGMTNNARMIANLIKNRKIGLFMTLGADPTSDHAKECFENEKMFFEQNGCEVVCEFWCQGAIDKNLIETMRKNAPQMITPQKEEKWQKASSHPDENDIKQAVLAFMEF